MTIRAAKVSVPLFLFSVGSSWGFVFTLTARGDSAPTEVILSNPAFMPSENVTISQSGTGGNALQSRHTSSTDWKGLGQSFKWETEEDLDGIGFYMDSTQSIWNQNQQYVLVVQELDGYRGAPTELVCQAEFEMTKEHVGANKWLYIDIDNLNLASNQWYGFTLCPAENDLSGVNRMYWATSSNDNAYIGGSANLMDICIRGLPPANINYGSAGRDVTFYLQSMKYPAPDDIPLGPSGISSPGGLNLPVMSADSDDDSPSIAAVTELVKPGETVGITGFELENLELVVWTEGKYWSQDVIRSDRYRAQALLPETVSSVIGGVTGTVPHSTALVWPHSGSSYGRPIRINGPELWWIWPCRKFTYDADHTIRVFGCNLVSGSYAPKVVAQRGADTPVILTVTDSNPYCVTAQLPEDYAVGSYTVWIHNGSGGDYGWSEIGQFEVVAAYAPTATYTVDSYAGTDHQKILSAISAAHTNGGGILQLAARTYTIDSQIDVPASGSSPIIFRGQGSGDYDPLTRTLSGTGTVIRNSAAFSDDRMFEVLGNGSGFENLTLMGDLGSIKSPVFICAADVTLKNMRSVSFSTNEGPVVIRYIGKANTQLIDSEFYTDIIGIHIRDVVSDENADYIRISNCIIRGSHGGTSYSPDGIINRGANCVIVENCDFQSVDQQNAKLLGRTILLYKNGIRNQYFQGNSSENMGTHPSATGINYNLSEQYLFHVKATEELVATTVASSDPAYTTVWATNLPPNIGSDRNWMIFIQSGKGAGQYRVITGSDPVSTDRTKLYLDRPWRIAPTLNRNVLVMAAFRNCAIYDNYINCEPNSALRPLDHKRVGVYLFHRCFNNIIASNIIQNVSIGVAIAVDEGNACGWNDIRDNVMDNMFGETGGSGDYNVFYSEHVRDGAPTTIVGNLFSIGNTFRNNICARSDLATVVGWQSYDLNSNNLAYVTDRDSGLCLSIIENNQFTDISGSTCVSPPANFSLLHNNDSGSWSNEYCNITNIYAPLYLMP